ncbi:MAG: hypothetical protein IT233_14115 [Bacteroidia bacterium]|nr:hypothetical protein [Bacteroidia bacterium]
MLRFPIPFLFFFVLYYCGTAQQYNLRSYSLEDGLSQSQALAIFEDSRGFLWIGTSGGGVARFDGKNFVTYEEKDGLGGKIVPCIAEDHKGDIWFACTWGGISVFDGSNFRKIGVQDGLLSTSISGMLADGENMVIGTSSGLTVFTRGSFKSYTEDPETHVQLQVTCLYRSAPGVIWVGTTAGLYRFANGTLTRAGRKATTLNGHITGISDYGQGKLFISESPSQFYSLSVSGNEEPGVIHLKSVITSHITGTLKDAAGRMWITTMGQGILLIESGNEIWFTRSNGLSNMNVNCVAADRSGNVWFGMNGSGFQRFRDNRFMYYTNVPLLNSDGIFAFSSDKEGRLWVGTLGEGAGIWDGKEMKTVSGVKGRVNSILNTSGGEPWIGTHEGLYKYSGGAAVLKKLSDTLKTGVRALFEDSKGTIWVGCGGAGLFRLNGNEVKYFRQQDDAYNLNVYNFVEATDGRIYFGTGDGIFFVENDKVSFLPASKELCNSYAGSMVKDNFGNIWVGTDRCVGVYNGKSFTSYDEKNGLASGTVYLLLTDKKGNIWVGTNRGVDRLEVDKDGKIVKIRNYNRNEGFTGIECNSRATAMDQNGDLWFGTIKGAIRFSPSHEIPDTGEPLVFIHNVSLQYQKVDWARLKDTLTPWFRLPIEPVFSYGQNHISFEFVATSKTLPENVKYTFLLEGFDKEWTPPGRDIAAHYVNLPPGKYTFHVKAISADGVESKEPASFSFRILYPFWASWWFIAICLGGLLLGINRYNKMRKAKLEKANKTLEETVAQRTAELIRQKEEKEILLKEIHHRVKNNLQVINSLINIQSGYVQDPRALEVFEECKNRVKSIALIHESLYKSNEVSRINVREYLQLMLKGLIDTYQVNKDIRLKIDTTVSYLNLNTILPLGLMLNEIISNSLKYAFPDTDKGEIHIELKAITSGEYELIIGDNGVGYKGDPFEGEQPTLGLELVKILTEQLDGSISKMDVPGTVYYLKFKPSEK